LVQQDSLKGMSQMQLAEKCNTSANYISEIEMGRRIPSFEKIEKIAEALKIPPSQLFLDENAAEKGEKKPDIKDYLQEMPASVKKELYSRFLALMKSDITALLDPTKY
jgi:transcriptional regulator with XRE-family HTH domain